MMKKFLGILVALVIMLTMLIMPVQPAMAATAPAVVTSGATDITSSAVTLNGYLTSLGTATTVNVSFEYGETTAYGNTTPVQTIVTIGTDVTSFSASITGFPPGVTWHFRAKAVGEGTAYGGDNNFHYGPTVYTLYPGAITADTATLNGELSGGATVLDSFPQAYTSFVWGTSSGGLYLNTTTPQLINGPSYSRAFSAQIPSLTTDTTYYYKAKVDFGGGTTYGDEYSFSTYSSTPTDKIVFENSGAVWVCNADGGGLTRLNEIGESPCWSRDGSVIAYTAGSGIYIMNADGSNQRFVTNGSNPTFSPDGTKIAYESTFDPYTELQPAIQVINIDGTGMTRLADGSGPNWSPDGTKIFYSMRVPSIFGVAEIYVMNSDGSNQTQLTNSPDVGPSGYPILTEPACSPDNSKVVYISGDLTGMPHPNGVYSMNSNGGNNTLLSGFTKASSPAWSSDGTRIAFSSQVGTLHNNGYQDDGIFVIKADGSGPYLLTHGTHPSICSSSSAVIPTFSINASVSGGNGIVDPLSQTIDEGSNATINITPDKGYQIASITDNGIAVPIANPFTICNVSANHTVVVTFSRSSSDSTTYIITATAGAGGTISPSDNVTVSSGANQSFTITPNSGYQIATLKVDGLAVIPVVESYTFHNVLANHTMEATFTSSQDKPPVITSQTAKVGGAYTATLNGRLSNPGTSDNVKVYFKWWEKGDPDNATTTETQVLTAKGPFSAVISGLTPATTYQFRAVAQGDYSGAPEVSGKDKTFKTAKNAIAPSVTTAAATNKTKNSATLNGKANELGDATQVEYYFEYGIDENYDNHTETFSLNKTGNFNAEISGLTPGATYNYRIVAQGNYPSASEVYSKNRTFKTVALSAPTVNTVQAINKTSTGVTLKGNLSKLGSADNVSVYFEWWEKDGQVNTTEEQFMTAKGIFYADISGLTPETTYYFRAIGVGDLTKIASIKTFKTLAQ